MNLSFKVDAVQNNLEEVLRISIFVDGDLVSVTTHKSDVLLDKEIPALVESAKKLKARANEWEQILNGAVTGLINNK